MRGRNSRRWGILLVVMLAGLFFASCGGGDDETTPTNTSPSVTSPNSGGSGGGDTVEVFSFSEDTPSEVTEAAGIQPIVILFYVDGVDDASVKGSLEALQPSFPSYVFLYYNYSDPEAYGDLSTLLEIDYTPAVIMIDSTAMIRYRYSGYIDQGSLNQSLVNLGRY
jgi:hypothetical protein